MVGRRSGFRNWDGETWQVQKLLVPWRSSCFTLFAYTFLRRFFFRYSHFSWSEMMPMSHPGCPRDAADFQGMVPILPCVRARGALRHGCGTKGARFNNFRSREVRYTLKISLWRQALPMNINRNNRTPTPPKRKQNLQKLGWMKLKNWTGTTSYEFGGSAFDGGVAFRRLHWDLRGLGWGASTGLPGWHTATTLYTKQMKFSRLLEDLVLQFCPLYFWITAYVLSKFYMLLYILSTCCHAPHTQQE